MKIKLSDLRRIVREAVADHMRFPKGPNSRDNGEGEDMEVESLDEVYMSPKNIRGIGPDVDERPTHGKYTPDQVMKLYPEAAREFVKMFRAVDPASFKGWYPRDILDLMESWTIVDGHLTATPPKGESAWSTYYGDDHPLVWDDTYDGVWRDTKN